MSEESDGGGIPSGGDFLKTRVRSYNARVSKEAVTKIVNSFWPVLCSELGVIAEVPDAVSKVVVHENEPVSFRGKALRKIDLGGNWGRFYQFQRKITASDISETLAHELGHAAVREICGPLRPNNAVNEGVAEIATLMFKIKREGFASIEEFREKRREAEEDVKEVWRKNILKIGVKYGRTPRGEQVETGEDWAKTGRLYFLFIFLLETRDKKLFHDFLRSTHLFTRSEGVKRALESTYGTSVETLKQECADWWYGKR